MPEERMVAMMPPKAPGLDRGAKGRKGKPKASSAAFSARRRGGGEPFTCSTMDSTPSLSATKSAASRTRARALARARVCARSCGWESHSCLDGAVGVREERAWHGCSAGRLGSITD